MPHKIMVIEDDPVIRSELQTLLRADGFEACAVTDFDRTIRQVKAEDPHLILLDVKLPGKSGYYLCSEIRSFSDVPIIFVTSSSTDMDELNSIMMHLSQSHTIPRSCSQRSALCCGAPIRKSRKEGLSGKVPSFIRKREVLSSKREKQS